MSKKKDLERNRKIILKALSEIVESVTQAAASEAPQEWWDDPEEFYENAVADALIHAEAEVDGEEEDDEML